MRRTMVNCRTKHRLFGAAALLVCALSVPAVALGADYVILVDCTGTMRYQGRAEATMEALRDFIEATRPGDFISIYGYGEEPFPALPEYPARVDSEDSPKAISDGLSLSFQADRTDITRGLELVWSERTLVFPRALGGAREGSRGESCVILLTDGKLIPCYDDYSKYEQVYAASRDRLIELSELFGDAGVPVYTIGLGTADKIDGKLLGDLSWKSGGEYAHASSSAELGRVFSVLADKVMARESKPAEQLADTSAPADGQSSTPGGRQVSKVAEARDEGARRAASEKRPAAGEKDEHLVRATPERSSPGVNAMRAGFRDFADTVQQTVVGLLGVIVGFVAIGVQRRQSWTHAFTKPLLAREIRVKGYLEPIFPKGVVSVRSCIPIENPGLPALEVGEGANCGQDLVGVLVEFVGTPDGTPPTLRVIRGDVTVNGEAVETERQLEDGDVVEFGDRPYTYLRGTRR